MTVVQFKHVSKWYPRYHQVLKGLKASLLQLPETIRAFRQQKFVALDDISLDIEKGETIGLIGANGSGKSTMLALMAGVLAPQIGRVEVQGRVCPLLELGAGFHYDLTGHENILLNGILLGLTRREVQEKMNEIVAFSELESFLDQPIRTYSSGMIARLGFSIAIHVDPEILIIDEILSVGDLHFQAKCRRKIQEFKQQKKTIVLVSHSPEDVRRLCNRVLWLDHGKLVGHGDADLILSRYERSEPFTEGIDLPLFAPSS
jgi:lipopolysaccharide transport system ATP-binding protein